VLISVPDAVLLEGLSAVAEEVDDSCANVDVPGKSASSPRNVYKRLNREFDMEVFL
jgi:hypothetical protein